MKIALISTVFNEARTIERWIAAIRGQTLQPDEFVIVDGGSTDDTVRLLEKGFAEEGFPAPKIITQRCNIAEGRNLAVRNTTAEIIAATDAGSIPDAHWLEEIIRPFSEHPEVGAVGGWCPVVPPENSFQEKIERYLSAPSVPEGGDCFPSSRNFAFTRAGWTKVGGYPEWLTLTGEDSLFCLNLHYVGVKFYYQPSAIVPWEARPDLASFLKMMRGYGVGSAEVGQSRNRYLLWMMTTLIPPLILMSPHPVSDAPLRYLRNAASAWGWVKGKLTGKRPPPGWKYTYGGWMSPEALTSAAQQKP